MRNKVMQDTSTIDVDKKIYRCSICLNIFNWVDGGETSWYGSYKAQEDGKPLVYYCSNNCKTKHLPKSKKQVGIRVKESKTETVLIYRYSATDEAYRIVTNKSNGVKSLFITKIECDCGETIVGGKEAAIKLTYAENFTLNCPCGKKILAI